LFVCLFAGQGVSLSRGLCWFISGVAVGIPRDAWGSTVGLPGVSQAGLEPVSGSTGVLLFSLCNVARRSFVWAGVWGVEVLILLGALFLPSVAPVSQQDF
jgi:hypothetical protein